MKRNNLSSATRAIHGRSDGPRKNRPVTPPIYLSATFESKDVDEQVEIEHKKGDMFYTRYGNPTLTLAESIVAELEGAESAAVFGSGMAAITTTLLSCLSKGDHVIFQREIYGGAHRFAYEFLPRYGIEISWFEATDPSSLQQAIRDNTRVIYIESPTNPTMKLVDIPQIVSPAKQHNITTLIDSTFATPLNTKPHDLGVDGVIHSATKYLGGHSDLLAGVVSGSNELIEQVKSFSRVLGGILDPNAAYLLIRGMKSLGLRVQRHNENGFAVARFLEGHKAVHRTYYPMLESHPQHELAVKQMQGGGGVVSFEIKGSLDEAKRFANALELIRVAPSLGGVESLISIPCLTSHAMLSPEEREQADIQDSLVRLAIGTEEITDIIKDISNALDKLY